jgi:hypothetical protein
MTLALMLKYILLIILSQFCGFIFAQNERINPPDIFMTGHQKIPFQKSDTNDLKELFSKEEVFFRYDLRGIDMDSVMKAQDNLPQNKWEYIGLGPVKEMYDDQLMRESFDYFYYPFSKFNHSLFMVYMNHVGEFQDFHYRNLGIYEKEDSTFKFVFKGRGKVAGYYPDSSFLIIEWPCCITAEYTFYRLKQGSNIGLDTISSLAIYYTPVHHEMPYLPPISTDTIANRKIKKGTILYTFPSIEKCEIDAPVSIGFTSKKVQNIPILETKIIDKVKWDAIIISKENISFQANPKEERVNTKVDHIVWIKH